jgi:hypothetical protein
VLINEPGCGNPNKICTVTKCMQFVQKSVAKAECRVQARGTGQATYIQPGKAWGRRNQTHKRAECELRRSDSWRSCSAGRPSADIYVPIITIRNFQRVAKCGKDTPNGDPVFSTISVSAARHSAGPSVILSSYRAFTPWQLYKYSAENRTPL